MVMTIMKGEEDNVMFTCAQLDDEFLFDCTVCRIFIHNPV